MENKEQQASDLAEILLHTFNPYSKYPLTFTFINEEHDVELKLTTSGQGLKDKLTKEILENE